MFTALAFLPPDFVRNAFQEIKPLLPPEAEDFALYFEQTYIGQYTTADAGTDALHPLRLTLREPPFPPSIWSVYERTLGSEPRTTNFLEGWHRRISSILLHDSKLSSFSYSYFQQGTSPYAISAENPDTSIITLYSVEEYRCHVIVLFKTVLCYSLHKQWKCLTVSELHFDTHIHTDMILVFCFCSFHNISQ